VAALQPAGGDPQPVVPAPQRAGTVAGNFVGVAHRLVGDAPRLVSVAG